MRGTILVAGLVCFAAASCSSMPAPVETSPFAGACGDAPVPDPAKAATPGPDVPRAIADLQGTWCGKWNGNLPSVFQIRKFGGDHVEAFYSIGTGGPIKKPEVAMLRGKAIAGGVDFGSVSTVWFRFELAEVGRLAGYRDQGFGESETRSPTIRTI